MEKGVFLAVEKRKEIKRGDFLWELSQFSLLSSAGSLGLEFAKFRNEREQERGMGRAGARGGKWLTLLSEHWFGRGLQNSEMCLLFNVGKLTRNRRRSAVTLTAFDTVMALWLERIRPVPEQIISCVRCLESHTLQIF